MFVKRRWSARLSPLVFVLAVVSGSSLMTGCERKERVLDVQTPGADVEVDRNIDTGKVEVEVERD